MVLSKKQKSLLTKRINDMVDLLLVYDTASKATFLNDLRNMLNDISQCTNSDIEEQKKISTSVCMGWTELRNRDDGIINWYFDIPDVKMKLEVNEKFNENIQCIDEILKLEFYVQRICYSYERLVCIGENYKYREEDWNKKIEQLKNIDKYFQSPIEEIPDDIWSFGKTLQIVSGDEKLKKWFVSNIRAFGGLKPVEIMQIENGADILRVFLYNFPF